MTAPVQSPKKTSAGSIEDHFTAHPGVQRFVRENPFVPQRLAQIVRWLEANMNDAGLKLAVERLDGPPQTEIWAKRFGLTPAEARLAAHLVNGGMAADYAAERKLSPHTVRNQLRSIYAKTNTNRQVSLLQLLLRATGKNP